MEQLRIHTPEAIACYLEDDEVVSIFRWIEGVSLITMLHTLSEEEQYELGVQAGKALKQIHSIQIDYNEDIVHKRKQKITSKIKDYKNLILIYQGKK